MATTKDAPPAASPAATLVDRLLSETEQIAIAAEDILDRHVATGEPIDGAEMRIVRLAGFDDREKIQSQVFRLTRVQTLRGVAGSKSHYEATCSELAAAVEAERKEAPALRAELEKIELRLFQLSKAIESAESKKFPMDQARETLRDPKVLPAHVDALYTQHVNLGKWRLKKLIAQAENRRNELRDSPPSPRSQIELPQAEAEVERLKAELEVAITEAGKVCGYYIDKL
ncbi:MAG: hypothetical protein WD851_18625 [Pirellulales bacterium]